MTISVLSIFGITDFMDDIIDLRRESNGRSGLFSMSLNILRFPSFQSVNILPENIKKSLVAEFEIWIESRKGFLNTGELDQFMRVISYLKNVDRSYEDTDLQENKISDFVKFFTNYSKRRNLDMITAVNNAEFTEWWNNINAQV